MTAAHMRAIADAAAAETLAEVRGEGARFAPWLVLLAQHMPLDGGSCSCGNAMYVGHLPRLLANCADRLARAGLLTDP